MITKLEELKLLVEREISGCRGELSPSPNDETFIFLDIFLGKNFVTVVWVKDNTFMVGKYNSNTPDDSHTCIDIKSTMYFIKKELFSSN
jgi:hypothetical protein